MTDKPFVTPRRLDIEPTGSLRERFAALAFQQKSSQTGQIFSLFDNMLPREGTRERNYCERKITNTKLQEILDLNETAFAHGAPFLGTVKRLPDPLVEALIGRAINLDTRRTGLITTDRGNEVAQAIMTGWDSEGCDQLSPDPMGQLGFFTEGLVLF